MHPSQTNAARQRRRVLSRAENTDAFGFFNLLTGPQLLDDVEELLPDHRERLFPPTETLAMFMAQALSADGSCRQAVNDAAVKRLVAGMAPLSSNTAAYCQARSRLPQTLVSTLAQRTGALLTEGAADWWHWRGKRVCLADGTTATMADTQENQAKYPQPGSQREGLGFPMVRVVALMCLASCALLDAATGACKGKGSDEQTLLRGLLDHLGCGDVLLGDAFFPTYFLLCELLRRGVDGLFEQYGARKRSTDFRAGERLGARDHLIVWAKPEKPDWMRQAEYDQGNFSKTQGTASAAAARSRMMSGNGAIAPCCPMRSPRYSQKETPSLRQVFFKLAKPSRQRLPRSLRVPPLILRHFT
jgi:hypothetical protein